MRARLRTRRNILWTVLAAVAAHGLLLFWLAQQTRQQPRPTISTPKRIAATSELDRAAVMLIHEPVALIVPDQPNPLVPGPPLESAPAQPPTHVLMDRDLPDRVAASAGGGAAGGRDSWTGRRDRENFQTQPWNNPDQNRLPRDANPSTNTPTSPESLARHDTRAFADRTENRPRARTGTDMPMPGGADGEQPGGAGAPIPKRDWRAADPMFDGPTGTYAPAEVRGRTGALGQVLTEVGPEATEAEQRAPETRDRVRSPSQSDEVDPAPIEMTRVRAGGDQTGVAGRRERPDGLSHSGTSTGSTAHGSRDAAGDPDAVRASRQNPYFSRMYRRMNDYVVFPEELATSLRQGEVVVRFRLARDGSVSELSLHKSSGYQAFDRQVLRAVRHLAPFGEVPRALLSERSSLTVLVPYTFKNPIIRQ